MFDFPTKRGKQNADELGKEFKIDDILQHLHDSHSRLDIFTHFNNQKRNQPFHFFIQRIVVSNCLFTTKNKHHYQYYRSIHVLNSILPQNQCILKLLLSPIFLFCTNQCLIFSFIFIIILVFKSFFIVPCLQNLHLLNSIIPLPDLFTQQSNKQNLIVWITYTK
jgi:hypothetical protein